jgi:hypothetical protein
MLELSLPSDTGSIPSCALSLFHNNLTILFSGTCVLDLLERHFHAPDDGTFYDSWNLRFDFFFLQVVKTIFLASNGENLARELWQ